ncbi:hypothetical protein ACFRR7_27500 [Streptomyces sp. NPDC056909]|uniref:hypothetical protein n=1 Tax=Streptomyces sp. NPDC056909 TaxID=3345963 RepID=UPI0036994C6E
MEFTRSGRLRASGRRWVGWGLCLEAGAVVWAVLAKGEARTPAFLAMALTGLAVLAGARDLRRARRPFGLRIDGYGITLHEGGLAWGQIEGVALHYSRADTTEGDERTAVPRPPRLRVYPVQGADLPVGRAFTGNGRRAYDLVDTAELDQGVDALIGALTRYAGPRFEGAPHGLRRAVAPGPITVQGPGFGPLVDAPGPRPAARAAAREPRAFVARRRTGARLLAALAVAVIGTAMTILLITEGVSSVSEPVVALGPLSTVLGWTWSLVSFRRWVRPLRLRIGPEGLSVGNFGDPEVAIRWDQVVAVTVARRPGTMEKHPWLLLWPVPGHSFVLPRDMVDGHQTYPLVELRRLRDGDEVEAVTRYFAGSRYAEPA